MLSKSKLQTQKLAIRLAKKLLKANRSDRSVGAAVIALHGDLGAGKTTFVQGFMKAIGMKQHITSPTFLLIRKYPILIPVGGRTSQKLKLKKYQEVRPPKIKFKFAYHLDLYRIHKSKELLDLGWKKIIQDPQNIILIEWPERIKKILPKDAVWINFQHGKNEKQRKITIGNKE